MLSDNELANFKATFSLFEKSNGMVEVREIGNMIRHLGFEATPEEVQ